MGGLHFLKRNLILEWACVYTSWSHTATMLRGAHIPVICIAEIPESTLDYFLQCIEKNIEEEAEMFSGSLNSKLVDRIAFITTKDVSAITSGATRPAKAFQSPFLGESIEEVGDWFINNIASTEAFTTCSFLVMDSRTVEDDSCLLVCTLDGELKTLRCEFDVAELQISSIEYGDSGMEDGIRDHFIENEVLMTRKDYDLAVESGPRQPFYFPPNFVEHDGQTQTVAYVPAKESIIHARMAAQAVRTARATGAKICFHANPGPENSVEAEEEDAEDAQVAAQQSSTQDH